MDHQQPSPELHAKLQALADPAPGLDWPRLRAARHDHARRRRQRLAAGGLVAVTATTLAVGGLLRLGDDNPATGRLTVLGPTPSGTPEPAGPTDQTPSPGATEATPPMQQLLTPTVALRPPELAKNRTLVDTVTFLTADTGYAVTAQCNDHACRTMLLQTRDGAASWQALSPLAIDLTPAANATDPRGHVELSAANTQTLLAVETRGTATGLQLSTDGGRSWRIPTLPGQPHPQTVAAVATPAGFWILASQQPQGSGPLTLFRLEAGSTTAHSIGQADSSAQLHASATEDRAYLTDGTASVTELDTTQQRRQQLPVASSGLTVARNGTLILSTQDGAAAGSGPKRSWISTDRAQTWTRLPDPPFGGDLVSLQQIAPARLLLNTASGASTLSLSTDGGRNWRNTLNFGDGGIGITAVTFPDQHNGYALHGGPSHLYTTSGENPQSPNYKQAIAEANSEGLYVTHDGGATWNKATNPLHGP
jgi:hypothetical protein